MSAKRPFRVWSAPIFLGVIATVGLISALLSDGLGDYLAWLALGIPVAVCLWYAPPRRTAKQETDASAAAEHS
jgi:hypothetical protein